MSTMKAVRIEAFGGPDVLQIVELPIPEPREDEVLLKVHAASVNPVDYKIREGKYPAVKADKLPYILGRDVSGTIEACGARAGLKEGESIYAMLGINRGGYAEYVIVKMTEAAVKPTTRDYVEAAAVPLAGLTGWQGLLRHGGLKQGQRVLIHGGAGGVGHFAIQFAKAKGADVITTVAENHIEFVRQLGADQVIDYKTQRFETIVRDVDLVFDLVGGETQELSFAVLKKGGTLVSTLTEPSQERARHYGVRALRYTVQENVGDLNEITQLIEAGKVVPKVSKIFTLEQVAEAQNYIEKGHTAGKVVLKIVPHHARGDEHPFLRA